MTCLSSMIAACLSEKFFRVFRPDTTILGYLIRGVKMNSLTVKRIIMTFAGIFLAGVSVAIFKASDFGTDPNYCLVRCYLIVKEKGLPLGKISL